MLSVYMLRPRFPLFYIGAKLQKSIFLTIMMMATYIWTMWWDWKSWISTTRLFSRLRSWKPMGLVRYVGHEECLTVWFANWKGIGMSSDIWNPWHGCRKYSEGCDHCYMYYLDNERGKSGGEIYKVKTNPDLSSSVYHTESHCKRAYVRRPQAAKVSPGEIPVRQTPHQSAVSAFR